MTGTEATPSRVIQIVADGAPGGGTTAVLGLCEDLASRGAWEVHLITAPDSYADRQARQRGVEVHPLQFPSSRFDMSAPSRLRAIIDTIDAPLVHVHGGRAAHQFSFPPLRRLKGRLVYTVHGYHFRDKRQPLRFLAKLAEKEIARRVDHLCFVSNADRQIAVEEGIIGTASNVSVIYNGINPSDFEYKGDERKDYDLVFVGRMVRQKNPEFVVDVLHELRSDGVTLLMIGGGELEDRVRRRADTLELSQLITFAGILDRSSAIAALRRAKLYIFPSLWEGLPIGPMEAMLNGVPVVGSNIGGTREVIESGYDGILIDGFDPNQYAERIRTLLADEPRRLALSQAARQKIHRSFLRDISSGKYKALYEMMLSGNSE